MLTPVEPHARSFRGTAELAAAALLERRGLLKEVLTWRGLSCDGA